MRRRRAWRMALVGRSYAFHERSDALMPLHTSARRGCCCLSVPQLTDLLNRTIDAQPFLGKLAADPTVRGLFSALSLLGQGVTSGDADLTPYLGQLRTFHTAMAAAIAGHPQDMSWQRLLSGKVGDLGGQYRFVLAQPKLDFQLAAAWRRGDAGNTRGGGKAGIRPQRHRPCADHRAGRPGGCAVRDGRTGRCRRAHRQRGADHALAAAGRAELATDRADPGHARCRADAHIAVRRQPRSARSIWCRSVSVCCSSV